MKKIVIISNTVGLIYKFKFEFLEELNKLNYKIFLLAQNENEEEYLEKLKEINIEFFNIKISRRGMNLLKDFIIIIKYYFLIKKINPDYIYTFSIKPNIYGGLVSKILNKKYVANITGMGSLFQKKKIILNTVNKIYKIALANAKNIFFENNENMKYFVENKIIERNKGLLISGSGVNLNKFYPLDKKSNNEKIIFLFIGRIMKEKGIEEYLEVATEVKNRNVEFWILGKYEEKKYVKIIEKLSKKEIVNYLGETTDIRMIMKECDYLVQPSYHEGMSNVILEASAMGKLVLASDISGCKEAIYDEKFLFKSKSSLELKNKILEVLKNGIDQRDITNQMKFISDNFSRENVVKRMINIIEKN